MFVFALALSLLIGNLSAYPASPAHHIVHPGDTLGEATGG